MHEPHPYIWFGLRLSFFFAFGFFSAQYDIADFLDKKVYKIMLSYGGAWWQRLWSFEWVGFCIM